jgi:glycine/D-amino acid oxidase-like deaminating enzyme
MASPLLATPALARAARNMGARFFTRTVLESIEETGDGFSAKTSIGEITAGRIVNCAGANSGRVAAMIGVDIEIEGFPIQVNVTERSAPLVKHLLYFAGNRLTLKQAQNGGFLIGGGWPSRINSKTGWPTINPDSVRGNMRAAISVIPALRDVRLLRIWPAIVNGTNDWRPILGELPGVQGFFMNMFPWMGFTAGPMASRIVADMVLGRKPAMDISGISILH